MEDKHGDTLSTAEAVFLFHQENFLSGDFGQLETIRKKGILCDVTIKVKNLSIRAHRLVLATGIPLFRTMFARSTADSKLKEIPCDEMDPEAVEPLISYAYTGKIDITEKNVESLIKGSEYLHLRRVRDACCHFLASNLHINNLMRVRGLAVSHDCYFLVDTVDSYIRDNFDLFSRASDFLALNPYHLKKFLSKDDLNVTSEENVFRAVMRWVKSSVEERRAVLPDLLKYVRMTRLSPEFLVDQVCEEELIRKCSVCLDLVDKVKNHHLSPTKSKALSCFSPRPRCSNVMTLGCMPRVRGLGPGMYAVCCSHSRKRSVKCFDSDSGEWMTVSSCSRYYRSGTVVASQDKIYDVGGKAIQEFSLATLEWAPVAFMSDTIYNAGVMIHGDKIYCFGGHDSSHRVRCFDLRLNKWLKESGMSLGRLAPGVASVEDHIYVTGGCCGGASLRSVERFNSQTDEWNEVTPMLYERWGHGCTTLGGSIYVCGGRSVETLSSAETYNPLTGQWTSFPPINEGKVYISLVAHNGNLFAIGGIKEGKKRDSSVEVFDMDLNKWRYVAPICQEVENETFVRAVAIPTV